MTPAEIHKVLSETFGPAIGQWQEPAAGDPFILVTGERLHDICLTLKNEAQYHFDYLRMISALDHGDRFSSVYHLYSYRHGHSLTLRVDLSRDNPQTCSVSDLWPAANWHEREAWDMMGIVYTGHPDLTRILLPLDWEGHPLRKDYKQPESYHGIKND